MAFGRIDAPYLFIMNNQPSEAMIGWFWQKLAKQGIKKTDTRIVYLLDEPPKNSGGRPSVAQLKASQSRFTSEIADSTPQVVLPLGPFALYQTTGLRENIFDARGYLIPPSLRGVVPRRERRQIGVYKTKKKGKYEIGDPRYGNVLVEGRGALPDSFMGYVIPSLDLYHISSEGFAVEGAFLADLARAVRAVRGTLRIINHENFLFQTTCPDPSDFRGEYLAIDIETHGVDNEVIDCVAVSDGSVTCTVGWTEETRQWLNEVLKTFKGYFSFHNSPFDTVRLQRAGVDLTDEIMAHRTLDTMFGGVIIHPDLHKGLGRMATIHLDLIPWKWDSIKNSDPVRYSATDGLVQAHLSQKVFGTIRNFRMWPLFTGEEYQWGPGVMATIPELTRATEGGLRLNKPFAQKWLDELSEEFLVREKEWSMMFPLVDPMSTKQVKDLFYDEWKLPIIRAKKEGPTVNELAVIKSREYIQSKFGKIQEDSPWRSDERCNPATFDLLLKIREISKSMSTYALPALATEDAYVHPQYLPVSKDAEFFSGSVAKGATDTGRLASSRPNIQQVPDVARELYVPDREDWCFVQHDYSKAELWALAYMACDLVMLADLRSGDPYTSLSISAGTDRDTAKNVILAGNYLAGPPKVSDMILAQQHFYIPPHICKEVLDAIAGRWHAVAAYKRFLVEQCRTKGYIVNPFDRIRVFPDRRGTAAVNFIPQSIVADVLWCILKPVAVYVRSLGGRFTTTVHDSVLNQVPYERRWDCAYGVKEIMQKQFDNIANGAFFPVECEMGEAGASWAHLKKIA